MKQSRSTQSMAALAALLGLTPATLEREHDRLLGNLGMDSLSATRLRGALLPTPSYRVLYGLTVAQVAQRLEQSARPAAPAGAAAGAADRADAGSFVLTPMQESYVSGASQDCPCQVYSEFDVEALDVALFQQAVRLVVARHPMLHAVIVNGTRQAIRGAAERHAPLQFDAAQAGDPAAGREQCMAALKDEPGRHWDIRLTRLDAGTVRIHLLLDMLFIDASSAMLLCREVAEHYQSLLRDGVPAAPAGSALAFRDYCDQLADKQSSQASLDYWNERCGWMPGPPRLPRLKSGGGHGVHFRRAAAALGQAEWSALKARAGELQVTPNALLLAVFADVLRFYAEEAEFSLAVAMSERPVVRDNDFSGLVGEFSNILLCPVTARLGESIAERAVAIHRDLCAGLEHGDVSGLEVTRMLRRHRADPHLVFPTVFTSLLGIVRADLELADCHTRLHYQQSQTPQLTLDHQVYELHGELRVNWDYDANVYSAELMADMLACFAQLLRQVGAGAPSPAALAPETLAPRLAMNRTEHAFEPSAPAAAAGNDGMWTLLNGQTSGTPLFLVGGVIGTVEKTFGVLAAALSTPVYAIKPGIPAVIDTDHFTLETLAAELRQSMQREVPGQAYSVGGLSFGAALAFEMGLQLEREGKLARVVMLDPRHLPPFTAPADAAPFEQMLERYAPAAAVQAPVLVFQCAITPIKRQTETMREISRSFLGDADVLERCRAMCPALELIHSDGHHFNLLNKHAGPIAARLALDLAPAAPADLRAEPIAIVGTACRLPGNVSSPEQFWNMLLAGTDCVSDIPASRFDIDEGYRPAASGTPWRTG